MEKLILGTAALICVAPAMAHAQSAGDRTFAGPYVGAYGGYGWTNADVSGTSVEVEPNGGDYGIYAGFQADRLLDTTINRTGLGLTGAVEFHYGWSGADDTVAGVNFEKDHEWGVNFRPGLTFLNNDAVVDVAPYAIIGYRSTEYEASGAGASGDETYDGFELGIGTELVAYDNVGVRLDYTHVWYGEENGFDPDEDNVRVGVGYKF
jgi:outer membrane immunogenic protein